MKKTLFLVILLYYMNGFTQNQGTIIMLPDTYNFVVERAAFIFEGEVIDTPKVFWSKNLFHNQDKSPYSSNIVKINKVLRGSPQIKEGTIELITYNFDKREPIIMSEVGKEDKIVGYGDNPYISFGIGCKGIFFCSPLPLDTANPNQSPTNSVTDNTIQVRPYLDYGNIGFIGFPNYFGLLRSFGSKEKVYQYLKRFKNITIPDEEIKEEK